MKPDKNKDDKAIDFDLDLLEDDFDDDDFDDDDFDDEDFEEDEEYLEEEASELSEATPKASFKAAGGAIRQGGKPPKNNKPTKAAAKAAKLDKKAAKKAAKKSDNTRGIRALSIIMIVLVAIGCILFSYKTPILVFFKLIKDPSIAQAQVQNTKQQKLSLKETLYDGFGEDIVFGDSNTINILLFGLDKSEGREDRYEIFRPDTIMVASINLETKAVSLVSIPRDSYVTIYGHAYSGSGKDKINSCFLYGSYTRKKSEYFAYGIKCLKATVAKLCGININYYVGIDMDGAKEIINTLGGVEVDVHTNIYSSSSGKLVLKKGDNQVLTGYEFLTYARYRKYSGGDIDRVAVQQKLLKALFAEIKKADNIMKAPKLISQTFDILTTDITFDQATSLAFLMMEDFSTENIKTATFPGGFGNMRGISYWIINQSKRVTFCKQMFNVTVSRLAQD